MVNETVSRRSSSTVGLTSKSFGFSLLLAVVLASPVIKFMLQVVFIVCVSKKVEHGVCMLGFMMLMLSIELVAVIVGVDDEDA